MPTSYEQNNAAAGAVEKDLFGEKQWDASSDAHIEEVKGTATVTDEVTELSAIEATAASTAAWLISVTVSLGGFLFGYEIHRRRLRVDPMPPTTMLTSKRHAVTIQVTSHPS